MNVKIERVSLIYSGVNTIEGVYKDTSHIRLVLSIYDSYDINLLNKNSEIIEKYLDALLTNIASQDHT